MKRIFIQMAALLTVILVGFLLPTLTYAAPAPNSQIINEVIAEETKEVYTKGKVLEVKEIDEKPRENTIVSKSLQTKVKILNGEFKGETLNIRHDFSGNPVYDFEIKKNDRVVVLLNVKGNQIIQGNIANLARDSYLLYLTIFFFIVILVIGGKKGLASVSTLAIIVLAVLKFLLPAILKGYDPVWTTILMSTVVTTISMLVIGGLNVKSLAAIVGTMGGVISTGIIAKIVIGLGRLNGLSSEESGMLLYIPQQTQFDFQGLLFAGIIIGALGAVMDTSMSISSAIWEIHTANPKLTWWELTKSGLNVGKDTMGTMSNTLILAYTGGSLPLLLLIVAYKEPFIKILNLDMIATEVVRSLAGSIGIFLAIPLTAIFAGYYLVKINSKKEKKEQI